MQRQTFEHWLMEFSQKRQDGETVGQAFIEEFLPHCRWEWLYYEEDDERAIKEILRFLVDCGFYPLMPR